MLIVQISPKSRIMIEKKLEKINKNGVFLMFGHIKLSFSKK